MISLNLRNIWMYEGEGGFGEWAKAFMDKLNKIYSLSHQFSVLPKPVNICVFSNRYKMLLLEF